MPIETKEIKKLREIYEPWTKPNGRLREDAPQEAIDAYTQVEEWYAKEMEGVQ